MAKGITKYSRVVEGTATNHSLNARFDLTDGILGISQWERGAKSYERVLLNKKQVQELQQFLNGRKQRV